MTDLSLLRGAGARRRVAVVVISLLVVALGIANAASSTASGASSKSSPGCGTTSPGTTTLSLSVDGFTRTVIVHIPLGSKSTTALPLVFNLHGSGSTALDQRLFTGMSVSSDLHDYIVAYPQGLIADGLGYDWNVPGVPLTGNRPVPSNAPNDVKFLTQLVGILESKYCVNENMVYATGFSGGARMVSQLACADSKIFAAIAPVSGLRRPLPCHTKRAVPVIAFHGSDDAVDPFNGNGEKYWTYSVTTAAKDWAKQDKCSTKATDSTPDANVKLTSYSGCANGAAVELYEVIGLGHEWPGGPTMPSSIVSELGPQNDAINASALMWAFFAAHPIS